MRAVRCTEGGVEVVDVSPPEGAGVRVRVRSAGICGSDLSLIKSGPVPYTLGHEMAGELADGTPVAIEPLLPCGQCEVCARGSYHLCDQAIVTIMGVGSEGGMCDEIVVPDRCLVRLPAGLDPVDACLVEPMAVAIHALRVAEVIAGQRLTIFGAGAIGLCVLAAADAMGCRVRVVARHEPQRVAARRLGATTAEARCDVAVVAAGTDSALRDALQDCRPGGTVVIVGTFWGDVCVPGLLAMTKELRILSSFAYGRHADARDVDDAAALFATRPDIARVLITHRFPLDAAAQAFGVAADRASGAIKVALIP